MQCSTAVRHEHERASMEWCTKFRMPRWYASCRWSQHSQRRRETSKTSATVRPKWRRRDWTVNAYSRHGESSVWLDWIQYQENCVQLLLQKCDKTQFNHENKVAGRVLMRGFMKLPELSVQKPKAVSIQRAVWFNVQKVSRFYNLPVETVYKETGKRNVPAWAPRWTSGHMPECFYCITCSAGLCMQIGHSCHISSFVVILWQTTNLCMQTCTWCCE